MLVDGQQPAGLDLADEARADDVQRRGLARDDPPAVEPAEHEGADAVGVARGVQRVLVHEHQAERPLQRRGHPIAAASIGTSERAASRVVMRSLSVVAPMPRWPPARGRRCNPGAESRCW